MKMRKQAILLAMLTLMLGLSSGCQTAYYATMEKFGYDKREILVDRVEEARDSQEEAKEQFRSALEHFSAVTGFTGGDLEVKYEKLQSEFDRSEAKANAVKGRIEAVESVAEALFKEWEAELEEYSSPSLRASSQNQLSETRARYTVLVRAMRRAEEKIQPVLTAFRDQVLFLKHNLNAQAIASLQDEVTLIENEVEVLIKQMEASIAEANAFIDQMGK